MIPLPGPTRQVVLRPTYESVRGQQLLVGLVTGILTLAAASNRAPMPAPTVVIAPPDRAEIDRIVERICARWDCNPKTRRATTRHTPRARPDGTNSPTGNRAYSRVMSGSR